MKGTMLKLHNMDHITLLGASKCIKARGMLIVATGVEDLRMLFSLAEGYGYSDWLIFDASVVLSKLDIS